MFKHKHMCMAVKTITITTDAYDAMVRMKHSDESFSELFLRLGKKATLRDVAELFRGSFTKAEGEAFAKRVADARKSLGKGLEARRARLGL